MDDDGSSKSAEVDDLKNEVETLKHEIFIMRQQHQFQTESATSALEVMARVAAEQKVRADVAESQLSRFAKRTDLEKKP